jgi:hypothetical protein
MLDSFRFVEKKDTAGLVEQLNDLAREDSRSLSSYVGMILKKHVQEQSKDTYIDKF